MRKLVLALAAAAALSAAAPAQATVILSENFESGLGVFATVGQAGINTGAGYVMCCSVTGSAANLANHFVAFGSGGQPGGTLSTTFNTLVGTEYTVTVDLAVLGRGTDDLSFSIDGAFPFGFLGTANNNLDTTFDTFDFNFVAAGTTTILTVVGGNDADADAILDNISVATAVLPGVPEPSPWAMMLLGFAAIGFAMRRRKVAALA